MANSSQDLEHSSQSEREYTSEFSLLYKNNGKGPALSQQERRELVLKQQKENRHNLVDKHRDFSELFLDNDSEAMGEVSEAPEDMDIDVCKPHKNKSKFALMQSEWFAEIPVDLADNWLVKLAPEGFRVLVIAKKHHTVLLNERGKVITLKTHLPGGGLGMRQGLTVLDCIYNKPTKTIFVLDCLFWNTMSMIDSETNFRFYWLKNQFYENGKFVETNKGHRFYLLEFFPAEKSLIQEKVFEDLMVLDHKVLYKGIVFYHKELQYAFKQTPLFGWLNSYMLPEKLGVDVPQEIMSKMPKDYECLEKYLEGLEDSEGRKRKHYFRDKRQERRKMDTT